MNLRFEAYKRHAQHYLKVLFQVRDAQDTARLRQEWPQIAKGQAWIATNIEIDKEVEQMCLAFFDASATLLSLVLSPAQKLEWIEPSVLLSRQPDYVGFRASALNRLASTYNELGRVQDAISLYKDALMHAETTHDLVHQTIIYGNLGKAYIDLGEYELADEVLNQAWHIAQCLEDKQHHMLLLGGLSTSASRRGDTDAAKQHALIHLSIAREFEHEHEIAHALGHLGIAYLVAGQYAEAIQYFSEQETISRDIGDRFNEGIALNNLASAHFQLNEYIHTLEAAQKALSIAHELDDVVGQGQIHLILASTFSALGDKEQAVTNATAACAVYKQTNYAALAEAQILLHRLEHEREPEYLKDIQRAQELMSTGFAQMAAPLFREILQHSRKTGDLFNEIQVLIGLGRSYQMLEKTEESYDLLQQSVKLSRHIGRHQLEAVALCDLSILLRKMGRLDEAIKTSHSALACCSKIGEEAEPIVLTVLINIANIHQERGEYEEAIAINQELLRQAKQTGDKLTESKVLSNLGISYQESNRSKEAIPYFQQAIGLKRQTGDLIGEANSCWNMSLALADLGDFHKAIKQANRALRIREQIGDPRTEKIRFRLNLWEKTQKKKK